MLTSQEWNYCWIFFYKQISNPLGQIYFFTSNFIFSLAPFIFVFSHNPIGYFPLDVIIFNLVFLTGHHQRQPTIYLFTRVYSHKLHIHFLIYNLERLE
jgi:hypothetical protein